MRSCLPTPRNVKIPSISGRARNKQSLAEEFRIINHVSRTREFRLSSSCDDPPPDGSVGKKEEHKDAVINNGD